MQQRYRTRDLNALWAVLALLYLPPVMGLHPAAASQKCVAVAAQC